MEFLCDTYAASHLWLHFPSNMMNDLAATTPEKEQTELEIHMLTYSPIFQTFFSFSFWEPYVCVAASLICDGACLNWNMERDTLFVGREPEVSPSHCGMCLVLYICSQEP